MEKEKKEKKKRSFQKLKSLHCVWNQCLVVNHLLKLEEENEEHRWKTMKQGSTRRTPEVLSNPDNSVILWFCDCEQNVYRNSQMGNVVALSYLHKKWN